MANPIIKSKRENWRQHVANVLPVEGTWTPVLTDGTNNATHSVQAGFYTKIGRMVYIIATITITSLGSVSGDISISGLPFTSSDIANSNGSIYFGEATNLNLAVAGQLPAGIIDIDATTITLKLWDLIAGTSNLQHSEWSADGSATFNGFYFV